MSYLGIKSNSRLKWAIDPVTKVVKDKKKYDRKKDKTKFAKVLAKETHR